MFVLPVSFSSIVSVLVVVSSVFEFGLFAFGLYTKRKLQGNMIYFVVILAPILTYLIDISPTLISYYNLEALSGCNLSTWECANIYAKENLYIFGYELLPINGLITMTGLYIFSKR